MKQSSRLGAEAGIRKTVVYREEVFSDAGRNALVVGTRATAAAVIANPWAHESPDDLDALAKRVAPRIAKVLTDALLGALGGAESIVAFGKAAIVGNDGEVEHGAALIHTPYFGNLVREFLDGESIICFADARGEAGSVVEVPIWHKTVAATRDFYQTVTARVADAPRRDEIVVIAAASTGPRPRPRIGDRTTDPVVRAQDIENLEQPA